MDPDARYIELLELHDHTAKLLQGQHHLIQALVAALLQNGSLDFDGLGREIRNALSDLADTDEATRMFLQLWADRLNDPDSPGIDPWTLEPSKKRD